MSSSDVEIIPLKDQQPPSFNKEKLIKFFMRSLYVIPAHYQGQDPNRLTLLYFTVSGLDILGALDKIENPKAIIDWVYSLQVLPSSSDPGANTHLHIPFFPFRWQQPRHIVHPRRFGATATNTARF